MASRVKGGQAVVGTERIGLGRDADSSLGCGTNRWGQGYGQDNEGYRLNRWEYTASNVILGTKPNDTLASTLVLETHHPIMSMPGEHGGRLDVYIYRCSVNMKGKGTAHHNIQK